MISQFLFHVESMSLSPTDLFCRARDSDEAFWQKQEARVQGATGQPCCTLSGVTTGLKAIRGNFAVVIHGEDECVSSFRNVGPTAARFFCTRLTDQDFTMGETAPALEQCLTLIAEEVRPEAIFILGTCPIEVIGDRFEECVRGVAERYPEVSFVPMHTSGLKVGSQADMLDWMFSSLAGLPPIEEIESSQTINLLGLPTRYGRDQQSWTEPFAAMGLRPRLFPEGSTLNDWRSMGLAPVTYVLDRRLYPRLVALLEEAGSQVVDIPLPIGVHDTLQLFERVAGHSKVEGDWKAILNNEREQAEERIAAFKSRNQGLRLALGLRMLNNYTSDSIAFAGMAEYEFWSELGFDITLLLQGPVEKAPRFAEMMSKLGYNHPFEMFPEPWTLAGHLGPNRFDLAYLPDHCRAEANKAAVPMITSQRLLPWFDGVAHNIELIESTLAIRGDR
jgi:nitrogenase molybdenum-iron protein alpha/beta subunit